MFHLNTSLKISILYVEVVALSGLFFSALTDLICSFKGEESAVHILNEAEVKAIVCAKDKVEKVRSFFDFSHRVHFSQLPLVTTPDHYMLCPFFRSCEIKKDSYS